MRSVYGDQKFPQLQEQQQQRDIFNVLLFINYILPYIIYVRLICLSVCLTPTPTPQFSVCELS